MANTVTGPEILQENEKRVVIKIVIESDGSTSTTVFYDASARTVGGAAARGALQRIWFACDTGDGGDSHARLDFEDSDGDRPLLGLVGTGYWDFREFGGLPPSTDDNTNGDINVVIPSQADDGNMYTVVAEFIKTGSA